VADAGIGIFIVTRFLSRRRQCRRVFIAGRNSRVTLNIESLAVLAIAAWVIERMVTAIERSLR
jgi:hypothetical protein